MKNLRAQIRAIDQAIKATQSANQKQRLQETKQTLVSLNLIFGSRQRFQKELKAFMLTREFSKSLTRDVMDFLNEKGILIQ